MKSIVFFVFASFVSTVSFSQKGDSLRIITYNIHHANPPSRPGVIDIDTIVSFLKKHPADVIALQEVDVNTKRSGNINEAKLIADGLGMHVFFARAIHHDGGQYGVALLSKFPLSDTQVVFLPMDTTKKGEQRVLGTATIQLPSGRTVAIGFTHLDHQKDPKSRELQISVISLLASNTDKPFVLAGDLNAEPGSSTISLFDATFQRTCEPCPPTFPADFPNRTIDFIGIKKLSKTKVVSHAVLPESYASDHRPVKAVLLFQ